MAFKVVGFKMPQEMSDRIDECVAHLGVQRTAWVRNLIANALEESGFPLDPKFLKTNQGRRTDMVSPEGRSRAKAQLAEARRRRKVRMLEREARARAKEEIERSAAKGSSSTRPRRAA